MSQVENDKMELQQLQKLNEAARKAESFSSACIYRVPDDLQKLNKDAYNPSAIAIGPVHRDKFLQTPLQQVKLSYTKNLLYRLPLRMEDQQKLTAGMEEESAKQKLVELAIQKRLTVLLECMKTLVDKAKKCYAEEVTLDEKMMSEMMVFDGCFILEFLYRYRIRTYTGPDRDPIFCNSLTFANVQKDLVLLENQIPFFVLEKLFQLTVGQIPNRLNENWSLSDYVGWCYRKWMSPLPNSDNSSSSSAQCYHILHNIHNGSLPHYQTEQEKFNYREMPTASELVYAGVKFVPDPGNDQFKFKFSEPKGLFRWCHRAHFEIPPLAIYDVTESYLRNLIALEQSCPGISLHVSSYVHVMDALVNTDKDIQALEKAGVLTNCLGATQDATDLFNNLCKEIMEGKYFSDTCREATEYSKRFWPKNMAHVRRTYFKSPWTFIAFCVGFIVFIMTVLQFVHDFFKKSG